MPGRFEQETKMRWILFWVFVPLFVLIVLGTLGAVFFGFGNLTESERSTLFHAFLVEIGAAIIALFYSVFGLRRKGEIRGNKVRLNLGELKDVTKLVGKVAIMEPLRSTGESLPVIETKVLNDNGPYLPLDLPPATYSVYITINTDVRQYSGSFIIGTYLVDMYEE